MADNTDVKSSRELLVDKDTVEKRKKVIKYVLIGAVVLILVWLGYKYFIKK